MIQKQKGMQDQLKFLSHINDKRIKREESELLALNRKKDEIYLKIKKQEELIVEKKEKKKAFKVQYYENLKGSRFTVDKLYFAQNKMQAMDAHIQSQEKKKLKLLEEVKAVETKIKEHQAKMKKLLAKNEKFDYLSLHLA